jgi:hypothetical protein
LGKQLIKEARGMAELANVFIVCSRDPSSNLSVDGIFCYSVHVRIEFISVGL